MKNIITKVSLYFILVITSISFCSLFSQARIIVNSNDWRDVYSSMLYGSLINEPTDFLVSDKHGTLILGTIPKSERLRIFSSRRDPYIRGYKAVVEGRGYTAEETEFNNFNLEIGNILSNITNFIIVDDSYGYNAISVAPYAVISKSYVLFADRNNIRDIENFLSQRRVDKVIIYGLVDRQVRNALAIYNPEIINKEGDRFYNNIEIVKRYQAIKPSKQVVLTNGEFIEKEIMSGVEPVIFIGSNNVPDIVKEYIKNSDIDIGILIGNELVGTATTIRRQLGISVFVKFAQGARAPQGSISQVEALDMFYLPTYIINIRLESISYNKATNKLEVTLRNTEDLAVYFKGTYTLTDSMGNRQVVGDTLPTFLDAREIRTMTYDVEPMAQGDIYGQIYVIYGESRGALEKVLSGQFKVEQIEIIDECYDKIKVKNMIYNKRTRNFEIELQSSASVTCFADSEINNIIIDGVATNIGSEEIVEIKPGGSAVSKIKVILSEEDINENYMIKGKVHYGQRKNSLIYQIPFEFELSIKGVDYWTFTLIIIIIILIILIIIKRRRKKDK